MSDDQRLLLTLNAVRNYLRQRTDEAAIALVIEVEQALAELAQRMEGAVSDFEEFPKIARLSRGCVITEKIDGTNAQVHVLEDGTVLAGSRNRYVTPDADNFGFAAWVKAHEDQLRQLGPGRHFGEWWGSGIQRGYGLQKGEKRFSLFNVARWADDRDREKFPQDRPACCCVVPILFAGPFETDWIEHSLDFLRREGSQAVPGFMRPEGIVIWHEAARVLFKKTLEKDEEPKGRDGRSA
ncbi:MAG TPA: RNA ligase family protein [Longimicrobiaceae bacterium]|nr:RNA ligase family protein [Longimicrobiaceae bacterium]